MAKPIARKVFLSECQATWTAAQALPRQKHWHDPEWREVFQLVTAALTYLGNAVRTLAADEMHQSRATRPPVAGPMLDEPILPRFNGARRVQADMAKSHLASACVRLPAAVVLCTRRTPPPHAMPSVLRTFIGKTGLNDDLDRGMLLPELRQVPGLCCCGSGPSPSVGTSLAMVVAIRDEFAHGEIGLGTLAWRQERGNLIDAAYRCRISQAVLAVVHCIVQDLKW